MRERPHATEARITEQHITCNLDEQLKKSNNTGMMNSIGPM